MDDLFKLQSGTKYLEAQVELKARKNIIEISKTLSELTKMSYDNQAMQKFVEAITCFGQAVTAGVFLHQSFMDGKIAHDRAVKERDSEIANNRESIGTLRGENTDLKNQNTNLKKEIDDINNPPSVGLEPSTQLSSAEKQAKITEIDQKIAANDKKIESNEKLIDNHETKIKNFESVAFLNEISHLDSKIHHSLVLGNNLANKTISVSHILTFFVTIQVPPFAAQTKRLEMDLPILLSR